MEQRLDYTEQGHDALRAMYSLEGYLRHSSIEPMLLHLLKFRVSQVNGCAYCLHMHVTEARADGETEDRIYLLDAWREAPCYTERERAALAWTEALTLIADSHAPDEDYAALQAQFTEEEQVNLTLAITTINAWNRIAIGFRSVPDVGGSGGARR